MADNIEFKLEDFFPFYLSLDETLNDDDIIENPYNLNNRSSDLFYTSNIYKKEFDELRLGKVDKIQPGELYKQQAFISRFLSPKTLNDKMIVYHGIGTGKCVHPSTKVVINGKILTIKDACDKYTRSYVEDDEGFWSALNEELYVLTYDNEKIVRAPVKSIYKQHVTTSLKKYKLIDREIICTFSHKLYVIGKEYTNDINKGDEVYVDNLEKRTVLDVQEIYYEGWVYDLSIENYHNYFANGILTHNTCVISAVVESALNQYSKIKEAIVLTRNPTLKNDIMLKIAGSCTNNKYKNMILETIGDEKLDESTLRKRVQKVIKTKYNITTHSRFSKEIKLLTDEQIKRDYNNRIIIIDEAHNIRARAKVKEGEKSFDVYNIIHNFLHIVQGCKILLLTGTPMRDQPSEIVDLLNLLLPMNKQLSKKNFITTYFEGDKINDSLKKEFKDEYLKGIISYVRSMTENIGIQYKGSINKQYGMKYYKTLNLDMEPYQSKIYLDAYNKDSGSNPSLQSIKAGDIEIGDSTEDDDKGNKMWLDSRQASMIVFPDGDEGGYGSKLEEEYLDEKDGMYYPTNKLRKYIERDGSDLDSKLNKLKSISIKFYTIIKHIIENPDEKVFVYSNIVTGGGAKMFSAILSLFNFEQVNKKSTLETITPNKNRFVTVVGGAGSLTPYQTDILIDQIFNSKRNMYGEYIRVIVGSHIVGEGKSFKHIRRLYVLTPFWNSPTIDQAIGRGIRADSHDDLPEDKRNIKVFRMVAMPEIIESIEEEDSDVIGKSIDLLMYKVSEDKDIKIKAIERMMKESAVDCAINYERNYSDKDVNNSRECDYMECDYKCEYVDPKFYKAGWIGDRITDTYNLYFAEREIKTVKSIIRELYRKKSAYDFYELYTNIKSNGINVASIVLARALNEMISYNDGIKNKLGFINFLREDRDLYFLTDDPLSSTIYTSYWYASRPMPNNNFDNYEDIVKYYQLNNIDRIINILIENVNDADILNKVLDNTPSHIIQKFLEVFIFSDVVGAKKNKALLRFILDRYKKYINKGGEYILLTYGVINRKLPLNAISIDQWTDITEQEKEQRKEELIDKVKEIRKNPYGYYIILGNKIKEPKNQYKNIRIVEVREARKTAKGEIHKNVEKSFGGGTCSEGQYQFSGLVQLYYILLKKSRMLGDNPPQIDIVSENNKYTDLLTSNKFNKYLKKFIIDENIKEDLIDKLIRVGSKDVIIEVLNEGTAKEKKLINTVVKEMGLTESELKLLFTLMPNMYGKLIERVFNKTGKEIEEEYERRYEEEIKGLRDEDVDLLANVINLNSTTLCPILQEWFKEKNYYIEE